MPADSTTVRTGGCFRPRRLAFFLTVDPAAISLPRGMRRKTDKRQGCWLPPLTILLTAMVVALVLSYSPPKITDAALGETGPIERATLVLYLAGALTPAIFATYKPGGSGYAGSFVLFLFAARELDFTSR